MKEEARIKTWFHPFKLLQNFGGAILNNEMTLKLGSGLILDKQTYRFRGKKSNHLLRQSFKHF